MPEEAGGDRLGDASSWAFIPSSSATHGLKGVGISFLLGV